MIENKNDASKNLEIALQTLEQANNVQPMKRKSRTKRT